MSDREFLDKFPDVVLARDSAFDKWGPEYFFDLFKIDWRELNYKPLFLAASDYQDNETAYTYGVFEKNGTLYEVEGTQCKIWNFSDPFVPTPTNVESILYRINEGNLCKEPGNIDCSEDLKHLLETLTLTHNVTTPDNASTEQLFTSYSENVDEFTFKNLGIVISDVLGKELIPADNNQRLPGHIFAFSNDAAHMFLKIFKEQEVPLTETEPSIFGLYDFEREGMHVFFQLDNRWNNGFAIHVSHPELQADFQNIYNYQKLITDILVDISVSLWVEDNTFQNPLTAAATQSSKAKATI